MLFFPTDTFSNLLRLYGGQLQETLLSSDFP